MAQGIVLHVLVFAAEPAVRAGWLRLDPGPMIGLHVAATAVEAESLRAMHACDVVLAAGLPWLTAVREADPDCFRVLTVTGDSAPAVAALNSGRIDAFLPPPWEPARAVELLHQGAEACLLRRHNRALLHELSQRNSELLAFTGNLERLVEERTARLTEANERLLQQQQALVRLETQGVLSHLARGLAHELNNPLAVILGYAQRLQRTAVGADSQRRIEVILDEVERCRGLVDQLRRLAMPLEESTIDLDPVPLLEGILATRRLDGQPVPQLTVIGEVPQVHAAPAAFGRVLAEVVANAVVSGAQRLTLDGETERERVLLRLANDGATPSDEEAANATKPFFTTRSAEGARGLGLAVAAGLLRDQAGHLDLQPREGGGAVAVIHLPCASDPGKTLSGPHRAAGGGGTVLVVDDDALVGELLGDVLRELGLTVRLTHTCAEARQAARELLAPGGAGIAALIADLRLPDGSGAVLLDEFDHQHPALAGRGALITGDVLPDGCSRPMLAKPFRLEQVGQLLMKLLPPR